MYFFSDAGLDEVSPPFSSPSISPSFFEDPRERSLENQVPGRERPRTKKRASEVSRKFSLGRGKAWAYGRGVCTQGSQNEIAQGSPTPWVSITQRGDGREGGMASERHGREEWEGGRDIAGGDRRGGRRKDRAYCCMMALFNPQGVLPSLACNHVGPEGALRSSTTPGDAPPARVPIGRTQSAMPSISMSTGPVQPEPSTSSVSMDIVPAITGFGIRTYSNSAVSNPAATSSPSRESKEKAEEVARRVVSQNQC